MDAIHEYFQGVAEGIDNDFPVGVYGSHSVLCYLRDRQTADYYLQTYAWSYGKIASLNGIEGPKSTRSIQETKLKYLTR